MKYESKEIGTCDLFINEDKVNHELTSELIIKATSNSGIRQFIKCKLIGYYSSPNLFGYPEFKDKLEERIAVVFQFKHKETGETIKQGVALVNKINVSYPDNDVSVITVKLEIIK